MHILSLQEPAAFITQKSAGSKHFLFAPKKPYVVSGAQFRQICTDMTPILYRVSDLSCRVTNFNVNSAPPGGTVLLYNGSGGYGDQVMTWPVARALSERGYEVHVLTEGGNDCLWWMNPWVKAVHLVPLDYALFELFDHFAIMETVANFDEHPDQRHPTDAMLFKLGIDPDTVVHKTVTPLYTEDEQRRADEVVAGRRVGIFQLAASRPNRSLPVAQCVQFLQRAVEMTPGMKWFCPVDRYIPEAYAREVQAAGLPDVSVLEFPRLRDLMILISRATVTVSPDSFVAHLAGVHGVPCVGLWGLTDPNTRVRYYRGHVPVRRTTACAYAPCRHCGESLPVFCPSRDNPDQHCDVLRALTLADFAQGLEAALSMHTQLALSTSTDSQSQP